MGAHRSIPFSVKFSTVSSVLFSSDFNKVSKFKYTKQKVWHLLKEGSLGGGVKHFFGFSLKSCVFGMLFLFLATYSQAADARDVRPYSDSSASVLFVTSSFAAVKAVGVTPDGCEHDPRFFNSNGVALKQVLTEEDADRYFKFLAHSNIAFEVPESENCAFRAERAAKYLEEQGVYSQKVFLSGAFQVKNGFVVNSEMNWTFHVAPMVSVSVNGKLVQMILDPSLFTKPVPLKVWSEAIAKKGCGEIPNAQDTAPWDKPPVPCEYQIIERFQLRMPEYYRHQTPPRNPPSNWDDEEINKTNSEMALDLPEALWRRDHYAGIEGTGEMAYRFVPSGSCVNSGSPVDTARCRPVNSNE